MHAVNTGRRICHCWVVVICMLHFTARFLTLVRFSKAKYHGNDAHILKFSSTDLTHKPEKNFYIVKYLQ